MRRAHWAVTARPSRPLISGAPGRSGCGRAQAAAVRLGAGRPCRLPQPGDGVGPLQGAARSCGAGAESGASPAARGRPA